MSVEVVLPERSEDLLSNSLRALTKVIAEAGFEPATGFLGGDYGYGIDYSNDVFLMHPFCWCERDDCPWCVGCTCPPSAVHFYIDGEEVSPGEWSNFFDRFLKERGVSKQWPEHISSEERERRFAVMDEANTHRSISHDHVCDFCQGKIFTEYGAEPMRPAPNFWHRPSNFKVWWYKYIGRDMECNMEISDRDILEIIRECMDSVGPCL